MAEEPQFPPLPDIGEILERKDRFKQKNTTILKCEECKAKYPREFKEGDYVFKKLNDETCKECNRKANLTIEEIYSEWIDPKKEKK
ncbi:MAG: hypothetical protein ACXABG_04990 [Promethearchaeota archaeon]|jgi:hypothetical protein